MAKMKLAFSIHESPTFNIILRANENIYKKTKKILAYLYVDSKSTTKSVPA